MGACGGTEPKCRALPSRAEWRQFIDQIALLHLCARGRRVWSSCPTTGAPSCAASPPPPSPPSQSSQCAPNMYSCSGSTGGFNYFVEIQMSGVSYYCCGGDSGRFCRAQSYCPHSHAPHSHTPHSHSPHTHTPHTHFPPPNPFPPPPPLPPLRSLPPPPPGPAGSSSLCQAPVGSYCCYDDPARPNYVCSAGFSCGRGVCVPAGSLLCGCSGQTFCPAGSTCCGSTCCPIGRWCGGDANSCACSSNAFPQPRDDLHCGSTPADVLIAARSPGYTPGAGSCGSGSEGLPPWVIGVSTGVPIALLAIIGVLVVCCKRKAARATTSQFVGGAEMRTADVASAATYDMQLNEAFLSATQPSTAINTVPGLPVFGLDGKPIINSPRDDSRVRARWQTHTNLRDECGGVFEELRGIESAQGARGAMSHARRVRVAPIHWCGNRT